MLYPEPVNIILSALSKQALRRVSPGGTLAAFNAGHRFHRFGHASEHAVFPVRGAVSLMHPDGAGRFVEVALVGNQGMLGIQAALGTATAPSTAVAQTPGEAYVIEAATLRGFMRRSPAFATALDRYVHFLIVTLGQGSVCRQMHVIESRWATRLLQMEDLLGVESFAVTQAALSQTLGIRRASVSRAAVRLHSEGLIHYERGKLSVADRRGLEKFACPCYQILRAEYERLFPSAGRTA